MNGLTFILPFVGFIACAVWIASELYETPDDDPLPLQVPCKHCGHVNEVRDGWLRHYRGFRCDVCTRWTPAYGGHDFPEDE